MECKQAEEEIPRREADLLDPAQLAELQAHLANCASCRQAEARFKEAERALSSLPIKRAPPNFLEDSWRRIQKAEPRPTGRMQRLRNIIGTDKGPPVWLPLAAAALVIGIVVVLPMVRDRGGESAGPLYKVIAKEGAATVQELPHGRALCETHGGKIELDHLGRAHWLLSGPDTKLSIGLGRADAIELTAGAADVSVPAGQNQAYAAVVSAARLQGTGVRFHVTAGSPAQLELTEGHLHIAGAEWSRDLNPGDKLAWTEAGPAK